MNESKLLTVLNAMLGSLVLCSGIAFHIGLNHFEVVNPLTDWFLNRDAAKWPFYGTTAFTGVMLMTSGRRGSQVAELTARFGRKVTDFYAGAGGALLGWVLGICAAAVFDAPALYWGFSVVIAGMASCIVAIPIFGIIATQSAVGDFNNRLFYAPWRAKGLRSLGLIMLSLSIYWFMEDCLLT